MHLGGRVMLKKRLRTTSVTQGKVKKQSIFRTGYMKGKTSMFIQHKHTSE